MLEQQLTDIHANLKFQLARSGGCRVPHAYDQSQSGRLQRAQSSVMDIGFGNRLSVCVHRGREITFSVAQFRSRNSHLHFDGAIFPVPLIVSRVVAQSISLPSITDGFLCRGCQVIGSVESLASRLVGDKIEGLVPAPSGKKRITETRSLLWPRTRARRHSSCNFHPMHIHGIDSDVRAAEGLRRALFFVVQIVLTPSARIEKFPRNSAGNPDEALPAGNPGYVLGDDLERNQGGFRAINILLEAVECLTVVCY